MSSYPGKTSHRCVMPCTRLTHLVTRYLSDLQLRLCQSLKRKGDLLPGNSPLLCRSCETDADGSTGRLSISRGIPLRRIVCPEILFRCTKLIRPTLRPHPDSPMVVEVPSDLPLRGSPHTQREKGREGQREDRRLAKHACMREEPMRRKKEGCDCIPLTTRRGRVYFLMMVRVQARDLIQKKEE